MQVQLFSSDFLKHVVNKVILWRSLPGAERDAFIAGLTQLYRRFTAGTPLNEAQTEDEVVVPALDCFNEMTGLQKTLDTPARTMRILAPSLCYWIGAGELTSKVLAD